MGPGRLILIRGCMFSGKSERLVDCVQAARAAGRDAAVFKHASDDRYAVRQIVTHNGRRIDAVPVAEPSDMAESVGEADLIAVDEAQFFSADLVDVCREWVQQGREVIVAGLDLDSWGQPFGPMPELAAVAEEIIETHSRCARCGATANRTQRLAAVVGHRMVGGPESYEPRCDACFEAPPAELRR